jgi:hypothetical protein
MKLLMILAAALVVTQAVNKWPQEKIFMTDLDHFVNRGESKKFALRYLVDETFWDPLTGPILFYAGNEGNIYDFY